MGTEFKKVQFNTSRGSGWREEKYYEQVLLFMIMKKPTKAFIFYLQRTARVTH